MTASIWTPGSNSVPQVDPLNQIRGEEFVATAGQTDFVITQFTYAIGGNALTVYVNATKVPASELTELSTTSFRIPACEVGDIVEVVGNTATADAGGAAIAAAASAAAALASAGNASTSASASAASAAAALVSENNAETAEANAETAQAAAEAALAAIATTLRGETASSVSVGTSDLFVIPVGLVSGSPNHVHIALDGLSTTAGMGIYVTLGDSGGEETGGYSGGVATLSTSSQTVATSSIIQLGSLSAADTLSGIINMHRLAGNEWMVEWRCTTNTTADIVYMGHSQKTLSGELTSVIITAAGGAGAFDAGTYSYCSHL